MVGAGCFFKVTTNDRIETIRNPCQSCILEGKEGCKHFLKTENNEDLKLIDEICKETELNLRYDFNVLN